MILAEIRVPQRRQVMANNRFSRAILFAPGYSSSVRFEPLPGFEPWKQAYSTNLSRVDAAYQRTFPVPSLCSLHHKSINICISTSQMNHRVR